MIVVDANLLVYAHVAPFAQHERARSWFPWSTLLAFLRLVTNRRNFERPEPIEQAWLQVAAWLDSPVAWIPQPTGRHREVLGRLLVNHRVHANMVPDAHLAALAVEHGLMLCSSDADFARFAGLRWHDPLREGGGSG